MHNEERKRYVRQERLAAFGDAPLPAPTNSFIEMSSSMGDNVRSGLSSGGKHNGYPPYRSPPKVVITGVREVVV